MEKKITFCLLFLFTFFFSQETTKEFYIVVNPNESIEPVSKFTKINGDLSLFFNQSSLQNFFNDKHIIMYEKAFPTAITPILQRTYILSIRDAEGLTDYNLKNIFNVQQNKVESVIALEKGGLLYEPNDYYYNGSPMSQLDLIRAPLAWEVTKGSPDVVIGISDDAVDINHEDLVSKIVEYYGQPSADMWSHGTVVATTAAGATDNGVGIASIGFNSKLITHFGDVPYTPGNSTFIYIRRLLEISQKPGVRVVNGSWYRGCTSNSIDAAVIKEIWDSGVLPVFAAGNGGQCGGAANYLYPQADGNSIVVTSVGHKNNHGIPFQGSQIISVTDEHIVYFPNHPDIISHHHYDKVDLTAPGYEVIVGAGNNNYFASTGTSYASPIVAGAAALIFSLRPDFSPLQVKNILKNTADDIYWIPGNDQFLGLLGTGRLNAFRAVKETKCLSEANPKVDFMIKDSREDVGLQPNNNTQYMWTSSDIFVRNQNDGKLIPVHQNPTYDGINPNFIYIRVTNIGCQTSSGNDTVSVNWAKASTSLNYPEYWDGTIIQNGVVFGGLVGSGVIPALKPGQEALIEIPWNVPNPQDYAQINSEPWHFCLLAKVNSSDDPLSSPMTSNPNVMVRNNNNLGWKNITVINTGGNGGILGGVIAVANPINAVRNYYLELVKEDIENGKAIYEEAEIGLTLDNKLLAAWKRGGEESLNLKNTSIENKKIVKSNNVILENINLNPNEIGTLYISFNFLTKQITDKENYRYHVIQKDSETNEIMGGETFEIRKQERPFFVANAGNNIQAEKNQVITLRAADISETAVYNWYDENENLIFTGKDLSVSQEFTKKYKLEVVALDGFKDYSEVEVKVTPYKLITMWPNPANSEITISFDIANSSSAYIVITNINNNVSNNYILNTSTSQKTINLTNYSSGQYSVTLIVNGQIIDSKNLIKN